MAMVPTIFSDMFSSGACDTASSKSSHQSRDPILRLSNKVMLSAWVHKPTLPGGSGNLLSVVTKSSLPSKNTVRRSSLDAIKLHVIFERAGAYGVVIITRSKPDEYAGGLIDLAGNGHEARRHVDVVSGEGPINGKRQAIFSRFSIDLRQSST